MITLQNWKKGFTDNYVCFFFFLEHNNNKLNSQAVGYFQVIQPCGRRYFRINGFETHDLCDANKAIALYLEGGTTIILVNLSYRTLLFIPY